MPRPSGSPGGGGPTVYVVDPDRSFRRSAASLLRANGCEVRTFPGGHTLLAALDSQRPRCVVMEIELPDVSGFEILRRLAGRKSFPPVIAVTRRADVRVAVRAMRAGAVDFLEKPPLDADLVQAVRQALAASGQSAPGAGSSHRRT